MDRRTVLAGLGAAAATPLKAQDLVTQEGPHWGSPVIDMHFHMRSDPVRNIAHQVGAGVTAANLLVRDDAWAQVAALQTGNAAMFPCWMASADVTKPQAEQSLTQAVKAGARGIGELKYHVAADGPQMRRIYDLCAELDVPVLIHFQEVGQAAAGGTYNAGIRHFAPVIAHYRRTKFILHADAFWANVSADYDDQDPYPTGPVVLGGVSDRILSDFGNVQGDLASNSANNFLSRDAGFTRDFLERHQDRLHFGSDCNCDDGKGGGLAQNSAAVAPRIRGKCVARETLALLKNSTTPEVFRKLVWTNAHRLVKLPA